MNQQQAENEMKYRLNTTGPLHNEEALYIFLL
jgi:hypothetical protein